MDWFFPSTDQPKSVPPPVDAKLGTAALSDELARKKQVNQYRLTGSQGAEMMPTIAMDNRKMFGA